MEVKVTLSEPLYGIIMHWTIIGVKALRLIRYMYTFCYLMNERSMGFNWNLRSRKRNKLIKKKYEKSKQQLYEFDLLRFLLQIEYASSDI